MTGRGDMGLAFLAAVALHVGALAFGLPDGEGGGGGTGGPDRLTLTAATPEIAAMVRAWDSPPETSEAAELTIPQETGDSLLEISPDLRVSRAAPDTLTALPRPAMAPVLLDPAPLRPGLLASIDALPDRPLPETTHDRPKPVALSSPAPTATQLAPVPIPQKPDQAPLATARPAERPARDLAAVAPRRAAGSGQTGKRGQASMPAPKVSDAARKAAASAWASAIERRIARHHIYPRNTRDEGRVRVAMVILPDGRLKGVSVARSSGSGTLDHAAVAAVKRAAPFPAAPEVLTDAYFNVGQWIVFSRR